MSFINNHLAKEKMLLKNKNYCISFITTVWNGEVIMCCYNNLSNSMSEVFCSQTLSSEDLAQLELLIKDFLLEDNNYEQKRRQIRRPK